MAYKIVKIELQSRLGQCAFSIAIMPKAGSDEKLAKLAATHLVYHSAGGKLEDRKAAYSDALASEVQKAVEESLKELFDVSGFESKAYVPKPKAMREMSADEMIAELQRQGFSVQPKEAEEPEPETIK